MGKIQRIPCGNGNCYLISNGKDAVLVDTCREAYRQNILNACKPFRMRLLVLTHGHIDHIQNAAFLSETLQIPIAVCKDDLDLLQDNTKQSLKAHTILGKVVLAASIKSFREDPIPAFTPTVFLNEGDTLDAYGISAAVIRLPGHTRGSIGLDVAGQYLIVGDALMNMFYPTVSMLYHDRNTMLESAKRISALGERTIYFGHGKPVKNRIWTK